MKQDFPQGSVFGGYGFFSYAAVPGRPRATSNATPPAGQTSATAARGSRRGLSTILSRWLRS